MEQVIIRLLLQKINNGSSTTCGTLALSIPATTFDCTDVGTPVVVTLTVTDGLGGSDTCTATVTVVDLTGPVIPLDGPLSVTLDANGDGLITYATITTGAIDVCGGIATEGIVGLSPIPVSCLDVGIGTVLVDITAIDSSLNNTTILNIPVDVVDATPPIAVPQDVILTLTGASATLTIGMVENGSTDACGVDFPTGVLSQTLFTCADVPLSPISVTYTVDDVNGNTSLPVAFNVTVVDNTFPVLSAKATFSIIIDPISGLATVNYTGDLTTAPATDACGPIVEGIDHDNNPATPPVPFIVVGCPEALLTLTAPIPVVVEATDASGNRTAATVLVSVIDNTPPVVTSPAVDITANVAPGTCGAAVTYLYAGADVNCMPVTVTQDFPAIPLVSGGIFPVGVTPVQLRATSASGVFVLINFNVTIIDDEAPIAMCKDITVALDGTTPGLGSYTMLPIEIDNGSTDNCGPVTFTASQTVFTCADLGPQTVTLTVTDGAVIPNVSTCVATVTVVDTTPPVATCQDVTVFLDAAGNGSTTPALVDNGSVDNCSIASMTLDNSTFTCADLGAGNTVTLTVTDGGGLASTCTATVTVVDNIIPVAAAQDVTLTLDVLGNATLTPAMVEFGSTDNCTVVPPGALSQTLFTCADVGLVNAETYTVF